MARSSEIGLFDAKTHFSEVVDRVARDGQPVTVTRRGVPLVDIVPTKSAQKGRMTHAEAVAALEELHKELPGTTFEEIKAMTDEERDRCPDM